VGNDPHGLKPGLYFACDEHQPGLVAQRGGGGRAVFLRDGAIIVAEGSAETYLVRLDDVPLTCGGRVGRPVESTRAATAAAWALKVPLETIRAALRSFAGDTRPAPDPIDLPPADGVNLPHDTAHVSLSPMLPLMRSAATRTTGV
jgi:cyanophycin synthetase